MLKRSKHLQRALPREAVVTVLVLWCCHAVAADPAITRAQSVADNFKHGRFDSKGAIVNTAVEPLQGKTKMVAQDGTQFSADIQCGKAWPLLDIFAAPSSTGDLQKLVISADLNLDGKIDSTVSPSTLISGICMNGYISCDAGTWNNCNGWEWTASNAAIGVTNTTITNLKGCYCINNSCGSNLVWSNLGTVLRDVGVAITMKIQEIKPDYVITDTNISSTSIKVYASDSTGCRAGKAAKQAYIGNNSLLQSDLNAEVASQRARPESIYSVVTKSSAASSSMTTTNQCSITRYVNLDEVRLRDIIQATGGTAQVLSCGSNCLDLVIGRIGDNYWGGACTIYQEYADFWLYKPSRIRQVVLRRALWDDYIRIELGDNARGYKLIWDGPFTGANIFPPVTPGACELGTSWDVYPNKDITSYFTSRSPGPMRFRIRVSVTGGGEGYAYARLYADTSCKLKPNDTIVDNCTALQKNPDCVLEKEIVDGVTTYSNYNPTMLQPLPSTKTVNGISCSLNVTRDWWRKDRTYRCKSSKPLNFDDALHRADVAQRTADLNNGFTEIHRDASGNWASTQVALGSPKDMPVVPKCEDVCKLKTEVVDDRVGPDYITAKNRSTPATKTLYRYAVCENGTCPAQPGETVVKQCQCLNEFAEAATIMQLMRQAGQDLICSP